MPEYPTDCLNVVPKAPRKVEAPSDVEQPEDDEAERLRKNRELYSADTKRFKEQITNTNMKPGGLSHLTNQYIFKQDAVPVREPDTVEIFDRTLSEINDHRGVDYGHPKGDFARITKLKEALSDCPHPEIRHALEMIAVKMSRLCNSPKHIDSIIDIAGYARTIAMILKEEELNDEENR